jgi:hypothetical protein
MKKYVILLCLAVLLTGCIAQPNDLDSGNIVDSTNDNISKKIPEGFSEEFYNDMLVANELIEKSIAAKYPFVDDNFAEELLTYYFLSRKDNLTTEDIDIIEKNQLNINKTLTYKEKHVATLLWKIDMDILSYHANPNNEGIRQKLEDLYRQFKILLEIEEP